VVAAGTHFWVATDPILDVPGFYLELSGEGERRRLYVGHPGWIVGEGADDGADRRALGGDLYELRGVAPLRPQVLAGRLARAELIQLSPGRDTVDSHWSLRLTSAPPIDRRPPWTVYRIGGGGKIDDSFVVLLLGDGFSDGATFPALASQLVADLQKVKPFDDLWDELAFVRVDLVDSSGAVDTDSCPESCAPRTPVEAGGTTAGPASVLAAGAAASADVDLRVSRCKAGKVAGDCRLLWFSDDGWAELANVVETVRDHVPVHAVAVLANLRGTTGGAQVAVAPWTVPSVATFAIDAVGEPVHLFAHELGHALGLLDEYVGDHADRTNASQGQAVSFVPGRNVWHTDCPLPDIGASWCAIEPLPWQDAFEDECVPASFVRCDPGSGPASQCAYQPLRDPLTAACASVRVWEGAFYEPRQYYRAANGCKMNNLGQEFCEACRLHLVRLLERRNLVLGGP
jgi:hypothetical protein